MRDVKEPEVRRAEIMAAAAELFVTKGYLNTTTQDIIDELKISRGLLYYHFKNKEDILFCMVEKYSEPLLCQLKTLAYSEKKTAIEKVQQFIEVTLISPESITGEKIELQNSVNLEENRYMMDRFNHKFCNIVIEYFTHIIEQGNEEGVFHVAHPKETAAFLITGYAFVSNDLKIIYHDYGYMEKYLVAYKQILERTLGTKEHIFFS
ncbi:TetR/AcrR family transcriptional regulator [Tissierella sp. MB52-C2]|uniref:TetR/AcrR family transcriptional regulator n=1 Tax=Tissierella sp. MB52-C2 TaxID=3070999 RepID=UPI00280AA1B8|nr:TetR/AcrR family transcriptional regulator [Tissierella sp. MB52-C2]WMM26332.1 TetR/AcrR family transcriptional regulator [Tissierella sp. MB52-C2]